MERCSAYRGGEETGGVTGDRLSHRFHHEAGQGPLESRAVDPGVDAFDEGGCGGDHPQDVGTGWGEPCGNGAPSVGLSTGCRTGRAEQGGAGQENGRGRGRQSARAVVRRTGHGHTEQTQYAGGVADGGRGGAQPGPAERSRRPPTAGGLGTAP